MILFFRYWEGGGGGKGKGSHIEFRVIFVFAVQLCTCKFRLVMYFSIRAFYLQEENTYI